MAVGSWVHSCPSCGVLGSRRRRRARRAAEIADAALVAFFARLNDEIRAERFAAMWAERDAIWEKRGYTTVTVTYRAADPQSYWPPLGRAVDV